MYNAGYMDELKANREDIEVCRDYLNAVIKAEKEDSEDDGSDIDTDGEGIYY